MARINNETQISSIRLESERLHLLAVGFWIRPSCAGVPLKAADILSTEMAGMETVFGSGERLITCMEIDLVEMKSFHSVGNTG
jgi:hypothetical protein